MERTENKRIKQIVCWLISQGIVESQADLGSKLGIDNKSYLSQIVNGKTYSRDFVNKLSEFDKRINAEWIETGEGEMLFCCTPIEQTIHGNNNTSVAGNSNNVNNSSTLEKAIVEIAEMRKLVQKRDEQIDRLITLLEKK